MAAAGYSGSPLSKKLGIKKGFNIFLINAPDNYAELLSDMESEVRFVLSPQKPCDMIHYFEKSLSGLKKTLPELKNKITASGCVWVSWPKKASKVQTDVSENLIREIGLSVGLVDIKVCSVDEVWSGLKFVIPVKDRNS